MKSTISSTARKAIMRALPLCLTICAARCSVRPTVWACWPAEKRSIAALLGVGTAGSRGVTAPVGSSGRGTRSRPVFSSLISWSPSDAALRGARRDEPRLAEWHGQRAQGDLGRVDRQDAVLDRVREAVKAARRRAELADLGPQPVVARAVAGALEPVVGGAEVGLAAKVRAALVKRAHVGVEALAVGRGA